MGIIFISIWVIAIIGIQVSFWADMYKTDFRLFRTKMFAKEPYWVDEYWFNPTLYSQRTKKGRAFRAMVDGKANQTRYKKVS